MNPSYMFSELPGKSDSSYDLLKSSSFYVEVRASYSICFDRKSQSGLIDTDNITPKRKQESLHCWDLDDWRFSLYKTFATFSYTELERQV